MVFVQFFFQPYLEDGEKIEAVFHRHPFVIFPEFLRLVFFGYFLPIFLWILFPAFLPFFLFWGFISTIRLVYVILQWYHDVLLVTNVSLLDVQWQGFFHRTSSRLEWNMIEGVSCEIQGFLRTVFHYGLVSISHAGGGNALQLKDAMNPHKVEHQIMAYQEKFVTHQHLKDADALKNLLTTMLRHHAKSEGIPDQSH